ncbi:excinuclease ABC subunit UvrA [Erysipelothrix inopinata]|uniref:UvrABC system protein A n=1 Tax=Erysipelothrix inopinata TaxID=225084 RepID=A0A7G9RX46_9FIRM|nr:excinuclease ABC subunit UvrA [Erysipelothrix inopinata]QNN60171.1 excinuclease ABC subunit UvrA [Erysipelothrix inopinata]
MNKIRIRNAHNNNLKHLDVDVPKEELIVITGVSGSGKSSLAFDLIFEEGRKKYLQSIGMGLDFGEQSYSEISGLSPTVAVKQNIIRQSNPRSTVGSRTGVLNLLTLLYSHEGTGQDIVEGEPIDPSTFSYLTPQGMCFDCGGKGEVYRIHLDKIITDDVMTLEDVFIKIGSTPGYLNLLKRNYPEAYHLPFTSLSEDLQDTLIYGAYNNTTGKTSYCIERVLQNRYLRNEDVSAYYTLETCNTCQGYRIGEEAQHVLINGKHIGELAQMQLSNLALFLEELKKYKRVSDFGIELISTILKVLDSLIDIKLGHLSLYREMRTLSGGELQRLFLHDHLNSELSSLIYIFDEPTSGLHESEKQSISNAMHRLKSLGNTVIIVTHDPYIIKQAEHIIDIGPKAGSLGGEIIFQGTYDDFLNNHESLTAQYLTKNLFHLQTKRHQSHSYLKLKNVSTFNLKNLDVELPLNQVVGIAGISGSGKSSLISKTLVPRVKDALNTNEKSRVEGIEGLSNVLEITQAPIGRKSNSNPITYLGIWDKVRSLYAQQASSKKRHYQAGDFSFNSKGACPDCNGSGVETINIGYDIQFEKKCPTCLGTRYREEILEVTYNEKNINDVLNLSVDEALEFLKESKLNLKALEILSKIGMGYIKLGQSTATLSGGEAQRIKLAKEIGKVNTGKTLYVLDEPSTGLSYYDIEKLLILIEELIAKGNSVIIIEHDLTILRACDWIVELGPESGDKGGYIIAEGTVDSLKNNDISKTGRYL